MRSKKGKSIEQRLEELTKNEVGNYYYDYFMFKAILLLHSE